MNSMARGVAVLALVGVAATRVEAAEVKEKQRVSTLDMPAPGAEPGNTYARAMSAVLSHLGTEVSYDRVMGLSGVAFILQVDTGGPFVDKELDCAWWPNDAWGFDLGLPVLSPAVGWEIRKVGCDAAAYKADAAAEFRRAFTPAIESSLRAGKPVLAESDHCFVVTGIDDQQPPLLGYGTRGRSTCFGPEPMRLASCLPWGLYVIGERKAAVDPRLVDLTSLRHILALNNEQAQGPDAPKTRFSGRQAWVEWLRLLRNGVGCDNNMLIHLRYNRRSAVAYLRDMAARHAAETAAHLTGAADLYQRALDELLKTELPYASLVKGGETARATREAYTAMAERVSKLEAEAMVEVAAAAAAMAKEQ